jgi:hypothetical protein
VSPLAGCDFVWEISHMGLLERLEALPLLGGRPLRAPFELTVPGPGGSLAHLLVESVEMDINGDDTATFMLGFARSSLVAVAPGVSAYPLSGVLTVNVAVRLSTTATGTAVVLDLTTSPVRVDLSPSSIDLLRAHAVAVGLTPEVLIGGMQTAFETYVHAQPGAALPVPFVVSPTAEGRLEPTPTLRRLRLRCFGPADRSQQGIGLFGAFFPDTVNAGTPTTRDHSAIPPGSDVLVALSLRAFQTFVFTPSLAKSLAVKLGRPSPLPADQIPPPSGTAGSITVKGVDVTRIDGFLGQGRLQVNTEFEKSVPCVDLSGSMVTYVYLTPNGATLKPKTEIGQINTHTEIDFWCEVAAAAAFGVGEGLLANALRDSIDEVVRDLAGAAVGAMFTKPISAPVPGGGAFLDGVQIAPDTFAMTGRLAMFRPPPAVPELSLALVRKAPVTSQAIDGTWTTTLWCHNVAKPYRYVETRQTQAQTHEVRATLLALPLTIQYSVRGGFGPWQRLTRDPVVGGSSVTVPALQCRYPHPLAAGGSVVSRDVNLTYTFNGDQVTLVSGQGQGNFDVDLRAEVLDASGNPPVGVDPAPFLSVNFEGDVVVMSEEYKADLRECGKRARAVSEHYAISESVPRWKLAFTPLERDILDDWEALTSLPGIGDDAAGRFRTAHSNVLDRVDAAQRTAAAEAAVSAGEAGVTPQLEEAISVLQAALVRVRMGQ